MSNIPDDDDMPCLISSNDADKLDSLSKEERIQCAITAIQKAGGDLSVRKAATAYNVPRSTLQARLDGRKSRVESHAHEQNLHQLLSLASMIFLRKSSHKITSRPRTSTTWTKKVSSWVSVKRLQSWLTAIRRRLALLNMEHAIL